MNIERIVWRDHHYSVRPDGATEAEIVAEVKQGWELTTVGRVVYEDEAHVVLASDSVLRDGATYYENWLCILKATIVARATFKESPNA